MNNKKAIPYSENLAITSGSLINPKPKGPNIIPARRYPKIKGCLKNFAITDRRVAAIIMMPISVISDVMLPLFLVCGLWSVACGYYTQQTIDHRLFMVVKVYKAL